MLQHLCWRFWEWVRQTSVRGRLVILVESRGLVRWLLIALPTLPSPALVFCCARDPGRLETLNWSSFFPLNWFILLLLRYKIRLEYTFHQQVSVACFSQEGCEENSQIQTRFGFAVKMQHDYLILFKPWFYIIWQDSLFICCEWSLFLRIWNKICILSVGKIKPQEFMA